ncbi:MAG: Gfo/Idh/MocA family oxidoreductase [Dysgonamonadaceae bacterium]|nr:Gfo/Idh/MocA family oxidoreductase [Dysgonamonadaceae bacterium]MDD4728202.1 Gfo/Idh/MocA family oxidoreductase [Dysgonamonadaceae bacterium]
MSTRRSFLKTAGKALVITSVSPKFYLKSANKMSANQKPIRIGIIGAENSHTIGFGKMFNIDKKFPGVEVKYVWGETDEAAKNAMEKGGIPFQVKDPAEMMGKIDALIVDHRHPKYHLEPAIPFVKAGIPTFIDKPFCYRAPEGKAFLELAHKSGAPVTSYSSIGYSEATFNLREQVRNMEDVRQVLTTGPVVLDSEYGNVFFYGVHMVQPLMAIFGEDIEQVRVSRSGSLGNASLKFSSGLFATMIFKEKARGWETYVEASNKWIELKPQVQESNPAINYVDMVEMFRTGKEPRTHQSILNSVSVLEALEKSAENDKWVDVKYEVLNY